MVYEIDIKIEQNKYLMKHFGTLKSTWLYLGVGTSDEENKIYKCDVLKRKLEDHRHILTFIKHVEGFGTC